MGATFRSRVDEALRLTVLHVLAAAATEDVHDLNDAILRSSVSDFGPAPDAAALAAALDWLEERRCVRTRRTGEFRIVTLTELGADVAAGRVTLPGVRRPRR